MRIATKMDREEKRKLETFKHAAVTSAVTSARICNIWMHLLRITKTGCRARFVWRRQWVSCSFRVVTSSAVLPVPTQSPPVLFVGRRLWQPCLCSWATDGIWTTPKTLQVTSIESVFAINSNWTFSGVKLISFKCKYFIKKVDGLTELHKSSM